MRAGRSTEARSALTCFQAIGSAVVLAWGAAAVDPSLAQPAIALGLALPLLAAARSAAAARGFALRRARAERELGRALVPVALVRVRATPRA